MTSTLLRTPVRLSATTFGTLWDYYADLSNIPTALHVSVPVRYGDSTTTAERAAFAELGNARLMIDGHPHPDLRATLLLLSKAEHQFFGWLSDQAGFIGALAAIREGAAILAVKNGDIVHLEPIDPSTAAIRLVSLLPAVPAARGNRLTFHTDTPEEPQQPIMRSIHARPSSVSAETLLARPRSAAAQFFVRVGSTRGRDALHVLDIDDGRWMLNEHLGTVTIEPADAARIARRLDSMANTLGAEQPRAQR